MAAQHQAGAAAEPSDAPASSVRRRAAQVIDEQRAKIFANVASAVDGRDPEGVHDMRVATRRMRAGLKVFAPWLERSDLERIAPAVRSLTRALGRVRELDVLRLRLADLAAQASPQRALAIESIDARLARRRSRARARMMARFAKVDLDRLDARLQRLTADLRRHALEEGSTHPADVLPSEASAGASGDAASVAAHAPTHDTTVAVVDTPSAAHDEPIARLLEAVAGPVVQEAYDITFATLPEEVGTPRGAEALHAVRIAAKKLRYTLEIVAPYLGDGGVAAVKKLRAAQDKLGDFHDDTVLDDVLRPEIERALRRGRPLLAAELRALRASRRRALLRDERAVRAALVRLRDDDFVGLVRDALLKAGVAAPEAPEPPPTIARRDDGDRSPDTDDANNGDRAHERASAAPQPTTTEVARSATASSRPPS